MRSRSPITMRYVCVFVYGRCCQGMPCLCCVIVHRCSLFFLTFLLSPSRFLSPSLSLSLSRSLAFSLFSLALSTGAQGPPARPHNRSRGSRVGFETGAQVGAQRAATHLQDGAGGTRRCEGGAPTCKCKCKRKSSSARV